MPSGRGQHELIAVGIFELGKLAPGLLLRRTLELHAASIELSIRRADIVARVLGPRLELAGAELAEAREVLKTALRDGVKIDEVPFSRFAGA